MGGGVITWPEIGLIIASKVVVLHFSCGVVLKRICTRNEVVAILMDLESFLVQERPKMFQVQFFRSNFIASLGILGHCSRIWGMAQ